MELYINSTGIISGAGSNNQPGFLTEQQEPKNGKLLCVEPDYTPFIPAMQLRRMSKAVRIGIASSKIAMEQAGITKPDALSIGTAMGCLQDTELFLTKMTEQDEQMLTPTAFIQSTHNTVSGQIALLAGCYGHNLTFVQRGHSFEHALINAQLYLEEHPGEKMLVGGIDELTDSSYKALHLGGVYSDIVVAGEGAAFFVVSDSPVSGKNLCVKDISLFVTKDNEEALKYIYDFILRHKITGTDFVLFGESGEKIHQPVYEQLKSRIFKDVPFMAYKHLCGEYATASAFAVGLLHHAITTGNIPFGDLNIQAERLGNIVFINNYAGYWSCWLVKVV